VTSLATLLDEANLRRLAGDRSFDRGVHYAEAGAVARLTRDRSCRARGGRGRSDADLDR